MKKIAIFRKFIDVSNAVDSIWREIVRPEKPKQVGDTLRLAAYLNYVKVLEILNKDKSDKLNINFRKPTTVNLPETNLNGFQPLLKRVFFKIDSIENRKRVNLEYALLWGAKLFRIEKAIEYALKRKAKILFVEDGFYRSVTGGLKKVDQLFSTSHSLVFDDLAPHYDGNFTSRLELLIGDNSNEYKANSAKVEELKKYIKNNYLSKYNDQPNFLTPLIGVKKEKVLVIMQSFNDASLTIVGGDELSFKTMIEDAINENPNADILIKVHPDTLIKKNKGYADKFLNDKRVYIIDTEVNLPCLLNCVDKVYVYSSQAGFEALLFEKKVVVYGKPFYSGWGLTIDRGNVKRRGIASFNKIFHDIHFRYTYYFDPVSGEKITPLKALELIKAKRDLYFDKKFKKGLLIKLDGLGDWVIFSKAFKEFQKTAKFKNCKFDFLGDEGFREFFESTENNFNKKIWIKRRGNKWISLIEKIKNQKLQSYLFKIYLNNITKNIISNLDNKYDIVIVSCWNNSLQRFVNNIVKEIKSPLKISRAIYRDQNSSEQQRRIYNQLIPMSGDHLVHFRGTLEKIYLENIAGEALTINHSEINDRLIKNVFIFCNAFHKKRRLSAEKYYELAKFLRDKYDLNCSLYGLEPKFSKSLTQEKNIDLNFGISTTSSIINAIKNSDLYIGNDTGFLHYALSLGKRSIVVSNGNSYNTFLRYPNGYRLEYILSNKAQAVIESGNEKDIEAMTRCSDFDINEISENDLIKKVDKLLTQL